MSGISDELEAKLRRRRERIDSANDLDKGNDNQDQLSSVPQSNMNPKETPGVVNDEQVSLHRRPQSLSPQEEKIPKSPTILNPEDRERMIKALELAPPPPPPGLPPKKSPSKSRRKLWGSSKAKSSSNFPFFSKVGSQKSKKDKSNAEPKTEEDTPPESKKPYQNTADHNDPMEQKLDPIDGIIVGKTDQMNDDKNPIVPAAGSVEYRNYIVDQNLWDDSTSPNDVQQNALESPNLFETFDTNFDSHFPTSNEEQKNSDLFDKNTMNESDEHEYEPPPQFALFTSTDEGNDDKDMIFSDEPIEMEQDMEEEDSDWNDLPKMDTSLCIQLNSYPLLDKRIHENLSLVTRHPWNGNLITLSCDSLTSWTLKEVQASTGRTVHSTNTIQYYELLKSVGGYSYSKIMQHMSSSRKFHPVSIASGVHRQQGHSRVRVAVLFDVNENETKENQKDDIHGFVAVWQWGYATGSSPVSLKNVLQTPTSSENYVPSSLSVADGLLFLASKENKIYIAKPHVRSGWSSAILNTSGSKITSIAITSHHLCRNFKYLAVTMQDGFASVWTYDLAVTTNRLATNNNSGDKKNTSTNLVQPFCRLKLPDPKCGVAHSCQWLPSSSNNLNPFPVLAVNFGNYVAVYNVSLPRDLTSSSQTSESKSDTKVQKSNSTHEKMKKSINDTAELLPILTQDIIFQQNDEKNSAPETGSVPFCSWLCLGHRIPPCLVVGFNQPKYQKTVLNIGAIRLPLSDTEPEKRSLATWLPFWHGALNFISGLNLVSFNHTIALYSKVKQEWIGIKLSTTTQSSSNEAITSQDVFSSHYNSCFFSSLNRPVSTCSSPGVDNDGNLISPPENTNVYHIHSLIESQVDSSSGGWTMPIQKHFLCKTQMFSTLTNPDETSDTHISSTSNTTCIVSDLTFANTAEQNLMIPDRVIISSSNVKSYWCAVMLRTISTEEQNNDERKPDDVLPSNDRNVSYSIASACPGEFIIVRLSNQSKSPDDNSYDPSKIHQGRDVIILEKENGNVDDTMICVLDADGIHLNTLEYSSLGSQNDENETSSFGWIKSDQENHCHRALTYHEAQKMLARNLFLHNNDFIYYVVQRRSDHRIGLSFNGRLKLVKSDLTIQSVIPKTKKCDFKTLWMDKDEDIISLISLPTDNDNKNASIAVSTSCRIMIIDVVEFRIRSQMFTIPTCGSLIPMGSDCVAFSCRCSTTGAIKVNYLSCLSAEKTKQYGTLATVPSYRYSDTMPFHLMGVLSDRFLYLNSHSSYKLVNNKDNDTKIFLPMVSKQPIFLLEALVANALCILDQRNNSMSVVNNLLKHLFERFGRKSSLYPYQEYEGIGDMGTGLSLPIQDMLKEYECKEARTFLLFGSSDFDITKSKTMPQWAPPSARIIKSNGCSQNNLHSLANGDKYLSEYLADPVLNNPAQMPRTTDTASSMAYRLALDALQRGDVQDAIKYLDFAGSSQSEQLLLHLVLSSQMLESSSHCTDPNVVQSILQQICGKNNVSAGSSETSEHLGFATSTIAALADNLKQREKNGELVLDEGECGKVSDSVEEKMMRNLAPTLQQSENFERVRNRLLVNHNHASNQRGNIDDNKNASKSFWSKQILDESKHIWSEGPSGNKEELLLLDRIEEWLGRCRSNVLGKEGAELAAETGASTLADILAAANGKTDNKRQSSDDDSNNSFQDGWIDGVGEGRTDEDNLSAYFRFAEGADEDSTWRSEGVMDLSSFQQKGIILNSDCISIEATTSNVDEGESGKVKLLHDIVFNDMNQHGGPSGLYLEVKRGGSLDTGMLHDSEHSARQRFSLEFWYHMPRRECVNDEIILARRSICFPGEEISKLCRPLEREGMLWELVVLSSGCVEFRTCSKSIITSCSGDEEPVQKTTTIQDGEDSEDETEQNIGIVGWQKENGYGGWNHVCVTFSSRNLKSVTDCFVKLYMKGELVASDTVLVEPPGLEPDQMSDIHEINNSLEKTALMFGLGTVPGFRMTDIRGWACERSPDDIKMMMYEYLRAAETRKKIKVIIRNKNKEGRTNKTNSPSLVRKLDMSFQDDTKRKALVAPPNQSRRRRGKGDDDEIGPSNEEEKFSFSVNFADVTNSADHDSSQKTDSLPRMKFSSNDDSNLVRSKVGGETMDIGKHDIDVEERIPIEFSTFEEKMEGHSKAEKDDEADFFHAKFPTSDTTSYPRKGIDLGSIVDLSIVMKESVPLSMQVRNSAAAAIVRGPPATRHFGGNRGGLLVLPEFDFYYKKSRNGIGSIAICGAEKTVIYTHDQSSPGKTYPIGASGAIISDVLDKSGNEYLCCFLAKDKRMVVFELRSKTVVVELQMTTKLNFWRYLPPVSHGMTLIYLLITPVGGFHWMPLSETPRPRQAWKRGPELQGKKIISYEEGGHNGETGSDSRSRVALLMVSTATVGAPVEAWCLPMFGNSRALCISPNILGCALLLPHNMKSQYDIFDPYIITASQFADDIALEVHSFSRDEITGTLSKGDLVAGTLLDLSLTVDIEVTEPAMAMGTAPAIFCLCCQNRIVVIVRAVGAFASYEFTNDSLIFTGRKYTNRYVIDAAIRPDVQDDEMVEVVALLCEEGNPRDGKIVTFILP